MPKFLEDKLKRQYGAHSSIPYKIMNSRGYMRGSKVTAKGRAAEAKHARHTAAARHLSKRGGHSPV